jgi:multidrug efflux pump subunit AcrB
MGGMLVATVTFTLIVVVLLAVLVAVTVVPVFVALQMADARRFSTWRWLVFSGITIAAGLGWAYLLHKHDGVPRIVAVLPLVLTWAGPAALWLLEAGQTRWGGRAGLHE